MQAWRKLIEQPVPRVVPDEIHAFLKRSSRHWRAGTVIAVGACIFGFIVLFPKALIETFRLDYDSKQARGTVAQARFWKLAVGEHAFMRRTRVYRVRFEFIDDNGQRVSSTALSTEALAPGTPLTVDYLRDEPRIARFEGAFLVPGGYWAGLWALLFPVLGVFGIWNYRHTEARRRSLFVHGQVTPGVIEQLWSDGSPDRNNGWVAVRFEAGGRPVQVTHTTNGAGLERAREAARYDRYVTVIYNARVPRDCVVIELLAI